MVDRLMRIAALLVPLLAVQPVLAGDVDAAFNQIGPVKEVAGTGDTLILAISDNKRGQTHAAKHAYFTSGRFGSAR